MKSQILKSSREKSPHHMRQHGLVPNGDYKRAGGFKGLRKLIAKHGGDAEEILRSFGIDSRELDDPEVYLPYAPMIRLLEHCADQLNAPNFGFELGRHQSAEATGPLAALLLASPTVGEGLKLVERYMFVHAPGARIEIVVNGPTAFVNYRILSPAVTFCRQINEMSLTVAFNILRALMGPNFSITGLDISSDPPTRHCADMENYFGVSVHYQRPVSALSFPAHYLTQRVDTGNPVLLRFAKSHVDAMSTQTSEIVVERVASTIRRLLPTGGCSLTMVAHQLGLHPRSLQNRLMEEGLEFRELMKEQRDNLARTYLSSTRTPLSEIAMLLGYSDQAAFTRAFSIWNGMSPLKYRKMQVKAV